MTSEKIKINLGSGEFNKKGFVNVDHESERKPEIVHDLNVFPYPFQDNSASLVEADHVLEHLENPFAVMKEIHRILENDGVAHIKVPHFSRCMSHPEHKHGFDITFPYYFRKDFKGGYTGQEFQLLEMKLRWFAQPYLKKSVLPLFLVQILKVLGNLFDFIASLSPAFCSRIWCYWVGGFEEIEFKLKVVK